MTAEPLPCLDSSTECIDQLTEAAIERSRELEVIDRRIAISTEQQQLYLDRADHHRNRRWTAWLVNPISAPFDFAANIFGGGQRQELDLAIENMELRASEIESREFQLQVRRGELEDRLREEVLDLVLVLDRFNRDLELLRSQQQTHQQQLEIYSVSYRAGNGSTDRYLRMQLHTEELENRLIEYQSDLLKTVRKLEEITGYVAESEWRDITGVESGSDRLWETQQPTTSVTEESDGLGGEQS
ncbi:TolC family protein [Baaleninema sp.]|uniref:TolC family protein n=1 Tax=Baaleninema sp. TaxID=3101197 RepID=UPI003CFFB338